MRWSEICSPEALTQGASAHQCCAATKDKEPFQCLRSVTPPSGIVFSLLLHVVDGLEQGFAAWEVFSIAYRQQISLGLRREAVGKEMALEVIA